MNRPALHPQFSAFALAGDVTAFLGPLGPVMLAGRPFPALAPLLDGSSTLEEIAARLTPAFGFSEIFLALDQLEREGLVAGFAPPPAAQALELPDNVVLCADELDPALAAFAEKAREPWLLTVVTPTLAALGPWFVPGAAPCLDCFTARRREIRAFDAYARAHGHNCSPHRDPAVAEAVRCHAHARLRDLLRCPPASKVEVLDLARRVWSTHRVHRHESCPRCARAEATQLRAADHISGYTGIIARVEDYDPELAPGAVCAFAEHLFPPDTGRDDAVWRGFRRRSSGKGRSPAEARTSAMMEAVERYSGAARGCERPRIRASAGELGDRAIPPEACLGFSPAQYRDRGRTNLDADVPARVPAPCAPGQLLDWMAVWSLTQQREKFVPAEFCFYGYPPPPGAERIAVADSNGCAAGEDMTSAILRGCLELVERDAVGIWWFNRLHRPAPPAARALRPPRSVEGGASASVAAQRGSGGAEPQLARGGSLRDHGRALSLLDLTHDFGIPVAAAISWQQDTGATITVGFGADWNPRRAVERALEELNQFLPEALDGGPGRVRGADPLRDLYLQPAPDARPCPPLAWPADPEACLARFVARAAETGLEVLVLNQTRADIGIPVVKVIIPGLCHFWPRFGSPRLGSVPRQLGWAHAPLTESQLNSARLLL